MEKWKETWQQCNTVEKITLVFGTLGAFGVIFFGLLSLSDTWTGANGIYIPMMAVTMAAQTVLHWRQNRKTAYISLGVCAFLAACSAVLLLA